MISTGALKILVLAHDLGDAAVARRVAMLREGGAAVTIAGFRRSAEPIQLVAGCPAVDFGQTYNAGFAQRIWAVMREVSLLARHRALFAAADIIVARNLEMLAIAVRGRSLCKPKPSLIYESLDIHRLLLRQDLIGAALRELEGRLAQHASALLTSSPAFISHYFSGLSKIRLPIRLVENKVLDQGGALGEAVEPPRREGPVWTIGWFGVIRCRKSLEILSDLVRQSAGTVEVIIRGRPALDQFEDFHKSTTSVPGLRFLGPYKNPDDLAEMYRSVHFTWAIDMFEEGLNSSWLLPNRLYEGGLYGSVPIAIDSVETGRFLRRLGIGVTLAEPLGEALSQFFKALTPQQYQKLEQTLTLLPRTTWVYGSEDCKALVHYLGMTVGGAHG
ncbi:MAG: glycosyl transferase family 1 [Pseudomonadota bacterium]|nr:glycosyl transferase family 1 [Pseudomonadota bacterium]